MRAPARRAVAGSTGRKRRAMKLIDRRRGARAHADMRPGIGRDPCHRRTMIEPELRVALAETDRCRPHFEFGKADGAEHCLVKPRGALEIRDAERNVVDHAGAPDLTSL